MKIIPVIHHLDPQTTLDQADLAFKCGADGVFLISHILNGRPINADYQLPFLADIIKKNHSDKFVGVNLLSERMTVTAEKALQYKLDGIWLDYAGFSSKGIENDDVIYLENLVANNANFKIFAGVGFKYQQVEKDLAKAVQLAEDFGFIPTTSGDKTGEPPSLEKVRAAKSTKLAIASGITPENVALYKPYAEWILVSSSICSGFHHFDEDKLRLLISNSNLS